MPSIFNSDDGQCQKLSYNVTRALIIEQSSGDQQTGEIFFTLNVHNDITDVSGSTRPATV